MSASPPVPSADAPSAPGLTAETNWLPRMDVILDFPIEKVWPRILRWQEWIGPYDCEHVSGPVNAPGEIKRISYDNDGVSGSFYIEVVRVDAPTRSVYRLLPPEESFVGIDWMSGYEIFNLSDLGDGRTLVTYETVSRMGSRTATPEEFEAKWGPAHASAVTDWSEKYYPRLREMLAGD